MRLVMHAAAVVLLVAVPASGKALRYSPLPQHARMEHCAADVCAARTTDLRTTCHDLDYEPGQGIILADRRPQCWCNCPSLQRHAP